MREPDLVENANLPIVEMRRHPENRRKRGDAKAADPGHENIVAVRFDEGQARLRQFGYLMRLRLLPSQRAAIDGHEARAEAVDA